MNNLDNSLKKADSRMFAELQTPFALNELAFICGGTLILKNECTVNSITTDSRCVERAALFIAIKGERFDGHDYISKAFEMGASCVLCERIPDNTADVICGNIILVENTVYALGAIAAAVKKAIMPITVAVTGSVGKTTTKEFVYSVLSQKYCTHKTDGNFNNEIGLPLVLLHLEKKHTTLVLECGMSFKGELERLSKIARPDIALITNIGTSHIENLGSREAIRDAKLEILKGLRDGGKIILNGDEPLLADIDGGYYISAESSETADMLITNIRSESVDITDQYTIFDICMKSGETVRDIVIPTVGLHNVRNAAYAYAVGIFCSLSENEIRTGLLNFQNTGMRQHIYRHGEYTVIEDCYNASPESMAASLGVLTQTAAIVHGRSVAVLGDMLELGEYSAEFHRKTGKVVADENIDLLFTFGHDARYMAEGAAENGMPKGNIYSFADIGDTETISEKLKTMVSTEDTVLFKASRAVKLERVLEAFKSKTR